MDNVTNNLSFDQLPKAVGELLTNVDYVISRLDEKKDALWQSHPRANALVSSSCTSGQ